MYKSGKGKRTFKKRYVRRANRTYTKMARRINLDTLMVKCESTDSIEATYAGGSNPPPFFADSGAAYSNFHTILANSYTWQNTSPLYARFKIRGMNVKITTTVSDQTVDSIFNGKFLPPAYFCYFPQATSSTATAGSIVANDNNIKVYPNQKTISKYWRFPDNFFTSGGMGLGVWCNVSNIASLTGELCVEVPEYLGLASSGCLMYSVDTTFYVEFSSKNS